MSLGISGANLDSGGGGGGNILTATLAMSSSDILNNFLTPIVAAPGVGKVIIPVSWYAEFFPGTTPYTLPPGASIDLFTTGTPRTSWTNSGLTQAGFLDSVTKILGTDTIEPAFGSVNGHLGTVALDNQGLSVGLSANPTLGNGTMKVTVQYYILNI